MEKIWREEINAVAAKCLEIRAANRGTDPVKMARRKTAVEIFMFLQKLDKENGEKIRAAEPVDHYAEAAKKVIKWHEDKLPGIQKIYDEARLHFGLSGNSSDYGREMSRAMDLMTWHKHAIVEMQKILADHLNGK